MADIPEDTDISLMRLIKKGDTKAFEMLVSRHQHTAYNLAVRFLNDPDDAEDVAQEVFIRIHKAAATYSPDAKFTTWMYTIVRNLCFNLLRQKKQAVFISVDDELMPELPSGQDDQLTGISKRQLRETVISAVSKLPPNMKMAVLLSKYHGMRYEEIAEIMGCTVNAVKLRIHRAKAVLAAELSGLRDETNSD